MLTQSNANNGGGFSVPRFCALSIFPQLDYNFDPPVQFVSAKDVHGVESTFCYIYWGNAGNLRPGLRFKMAFKTEDLSRISWFMGTIAGVEAANPARWPQSPWRFLR